MRIIGNYFEPGIFLVVIFAQDCEFFALGVKPETAKTKIKFLYIS